VNQKDGPVFHGNAGESYKDVRESAHTVSKRKSGGDKQSQSWFVVRRLSKLVDVGLDD
jgi:hypothetical protein